MLNDVLIGEGPFIGKLKDGGGGQGDIKLFVGKGEIDRKVDGELLFIQDFVNVGLKTGPLGLGKEYRRQSPPFVTNS